MLMARLRCQLVAGGEPALTAACPTEVAVRALSICRWIALGGVAVGVLASPVGSQALAQGEAICADLDGEGSWVDVAFIPSRYSVEQEPLYQQHVRTMRGRIAAAAPFSDYRDRFRFHVFPVDDPLVDEAPDDGTIRSTRLQAAGGFPIADAVAAHYLLAAHGCPADVVMVVVRELGGGAASEGLGLTADMLARRGITIDRLPAEGVLSARVLLEQAFEPIAELDWFELERRLILDRIGIVTIVAGEAPLLELGALAVHEFAHAFASLEDEYSIGGPFGSGLVALTPCPDETAAVSAAPERVGLPSVPCARNLVELLDREAVAGANFPWPVAGPLPSTDAAGMPVDGVNATTIGAFRGGAYSAPADRRLEVFGVFRSQLNCRMRSPTSLNVEFCSACTLALTTQLNALLGVPEAENDQVIIDDGSPMIELFAWIFGGLLAFLIFLVWLARRRRPV